VADAKDAIILGSGPNELVAAAYLARAGRRVLVVDSSATPGGTAALHEVAPGFRVEPCPPAAGWLSPKIAKDLDLHAHGLAAPQWPDIAVVGLTTDAAPLCLWRDPARAREAIAARSPADANAWGPFCTRMTRLAGFLETLYVQAPPRLLSAAIGDLLALATTGLRLRRLGKIDMIELLRTLPMSVQDLLDEWFEDDLLKATVGAGGVANLLQGPRSAGTAFVLLHHLAGRPTFRARSLVRGEQSQLAAVLVRAATKLGMELRTGVAARIAVKDGRATGIVLASGEEIPARTVVSGCDPRRTFLELVDPTELDPEFLLAVRNVKLRGARAIVSLALDRLPSFSAALPDGALHGVLSFASSLVQVERAYDDAKHGGISRELVLEAVLPSLADPSLAPAGKHVMSVAVQYAPYRLRTGTWDTAAREALGDRVIAALAEHAPDLPGLVVGRRVYTPADLERDFGLTEGHLYGGELTLDQILFMRPVPGMAHYRTPIAGLFVCGDATHPGGALPGLAGANAARAIVEEA
jgi:phytoene dehydrogenase-like protein